APEVRLDGRDEPLGLVAMDDVAPGRAAVAELARRIAELRAHDLVVIEAVVADVPVPEAQLRPLQRQLELLCRPAPLALGAGLDQGIGLPPPLAAIETERGAGAEQGEARQRGERLLA